MCASLHAESQLNTPAAAPRASVTLTGLFFSVILCSAFKHHETKTIGVRARGLGLQPADLNKATIFWAKAKFFRAEPAAKKMKKYIYIFCIY